MVKVTVDQRALIDKVLARYPGEFNLFRELIQNSDDANSPAVQIHFETRAYRVRRKEKEKVLPNLSSTHVSHWIIKNKGQEFDDNDWNRLTTIALGNPDSHKIGAFGVGFYTVFSVTESPFVCSGGQGIEFYWDENQLSALRRDVPLDRWTTFELPLRSPAPMPSPRDFLGFLATSITFMVNIMDMWVFFDGHQIGHIKKSFGPPRPINFPIELYMSNPKRSLMNVKGIQRHLTAIEAEVMNVVYTNTSATDVLMTETSEFCDQQEPQDYTQVHKSKVVLTMFTANVDVVVDEMLSKELHRCTKKYLPRDLEYSLVYIGKDEYDQSCISEEDHPSKDMSILRGLRADLDGHSLIFIGHATAQSTGIGGHMMSHFIPTIERELIDLAISGSGVAVWNQELLYVGGLLCRAVYEWELSDIQRSWLEAGSAGTPDSLGELRDRLHQRFLHILKFFAFRPSMPSPKVSDLLKASFYQCSPKPLRLLSSHGVLNAPDIKAFDPNFARFLGHIPMLSELATAIGGHIIAALPGPHKVPHITTTEALEHLHNHSLTSEEMVSCLQWWIKLKHSDHTASTASLLAAATLHHAGQTRLPLSSVQHFIDLRHFGALIPLDGPLPKSLIPLNITEHFTAKQLEIFPWKELTIIEWLQHISLPEVMSHNPEYAFTSSRPWAERVLVIISTIWPSLSNEMRCEAKTAFTAKKCIPTSHGLSLPESSYLPDANDTLFDDFDLPVVQFGEVQIKTGMRDFLSFIGVQTYIPLQLLLERQVVTRVWSIYKFIHYLLQLPDMIEQYLPKLKECVVFPREGGSAQGALRYRADALYPPNKEFRELQLHVIDWGEQWQDESAEAKFMYRLNLRHHPTLETIVELCSSKGEVGNTALKYLCNNLDSQYLVCELDNFREKAFIPAEVMDETSLRKPGEVFLNIQWKELGFAVVPVSYHGMPLSHLGVRRDPPTSTLIGLLPPKKETALKWLELLSRHISNFAPPELSKISALEIVPTGPPGDQKLQAPRKCYLGKPSNDRFYASLFDFVDFDPEVTHFLRACGSNDGPSVTDIAEALIANPQQFLDIAGNDRFLEELRQLAHHSERFSNSSMFKLCGKPTLLGVRREKSDGQGGWKYNYELRKPEDIIIADDDNDYQLFSDSIFVAPQYEILQGFYRSLGCEPLSKIVQVEGWDDLKETSDPVISAKIRDLVQSRLPLFLQSYAHAKPDIDWLPSLRVRVWNKLSFSKKLVTRYGNIKRKQDVWAIVERDESRQIELWLSRTAQEDMHELATCLCRCLFGTAKVNDTLLLETILSSTLNALERRGFNVDLIPQKEKQIEESEVDDGKMRQSASGVTPAYVTRDMAVTQTGPDHISTSSNPSSINFCEGGEAAAGPLTRSLRAFGNTVSDILREGMLYWYPRNLTQQLSQDDIRKTIRTAIIACHSGQGGSLDRSLATAEFPSNYCETSRPVENLQFCGTIEDIEVHLPQGGPSMDLGRYEPLARFAHIVTPIAELYGLPVTSLRIFRDAAPGRIAFNRDGRLYLNLLHFEEWHDQAVKNGDRQQCQLSWFLTFAHEIAHNINPSHNAVHEFWFSEICEAYFVQFARDVLSARV